jgi:hypothetical protein
LIGFGATVPFLFIRTSSIKHILGEIRRFEINQQLNQTG